MKSQKLTSQNPLEDKRWLKEFAEEFKRDIKQASTPKKLSSDFVSEIICTQKDIGEPNYPSRNKK